MTFKASATQKKELVAPPRCFLQSCTQIGSKILLYGGSDKDGTMPLKAYPPISVSTLTFSFVMTITIFYR